MQCANLHTHFFRHRYCRSCDTSTDTYSRAGERRDAYANSYASSSAYANTFTDPPPFRAGLVCTQHGFN